MEPLFEKRIEACLLAGALGDAVGSHYENRVAGEAPVIPRVLSISDDTQLTLATCEAIIEAGGVDPEAITRSFVRWFRQDRITGIGGSTLKALEDLSAGGHWAISGATGERAAGNGAAMRIAPLAFLLDPDDDLQRRTIRDVSRITHRHDEAYLGALAMVRAIRNAIAGCPLDAALLEEIAAKLPDCNVRDRLREARGMTLPDYAARFAASGYVVDSVPMAILAATAATNLVDLIREIVQCGGDTDTIASMAAQIYGAAHGLSALPLDVIDRIDGVAMIRETAARFSQAVCGRTR